MAEGKHAAPKSRRTALVVVGAIVAVALVGGVAFVLSDRDAGDASGGSEPDDSIPAFAFRARDTVVVPTTSTPEKQLLGAAKGVTNQVSDAVAQMYRQAFLNPANWRTGSYEPVFASFTDESVASAEKDVAVLTVGPELGASLDSIQPAPSKAQVKVLFDDRDRPAGAAAAVTFRARGTGSENVKLVSVGTYLLVPEGGRWKITSFKVQRADEAFTPKPASAATAAGEGAS